MLCVQSFSRVQPFVAPWNITCLVPLLWNFSGEKYRSGVPFPTPQDLPDLGVEPVSPELASRFVPLVPPGKPLSTC